MKILVICYFYYPDESPRSSRWTALSEYFVTQGYEVDVICKRVPNALAYEELNGVYVHRVGSNILDKLRKQITVQPKMDQSQGCQNSFFAIFSRLINQSIRKIIYGVNFFWKQIVWPDKYCLWYFAAVSKLKKLSSNKIFDVVITVSYPFVDHLLGYKVKKFQPKALWMVDIGDPFHFFCDQGVRYNNLVYNSINAHSEKKLFFSCDSISVTNDSLKLSYLSLFPKLQDKLFVAQPLLSLKPPTVATNFCFGKNGINLVYIGTLYEKISSPRYLLSLFASLLQESETRDVQLHFFGNINGCDKLFEPYNNLLNKNIFIHGVVPRDAVFGIMSAADILVNISVVTSVHIHSKLVEYASSGKPILNLTTIEDDSSSRFLQLYPLKLNLCEKETDFAAQVLALRQFIKTKERVADEAIRNFLMDFRVDAIGTIYLNAIENAKSKLVSVTQKN